MAWVPATKQVRMSCTLQTFRCMRMQRPSHGRRSRLVAQYIACSMCHVTAHSVLLGVCSAGLRVVSDCARAGLAPPHLSRRKLHDPAASPAPPVVPLGARLGFSLVDGPSGCSVSAGLAIYICIAGCM